MLSAAATNLPCEQKSAPKPSKWIRAGYLSLRADKNRFGRPFFPPCDENSICAGTLAFRASQLPVRAGKNPSVRPFFDLCRQKPPVFDGFGEWRWAKKDSCLVKTDARRP